MYLASAAPPCHRPECVHVTCISENSNPVCATGPGLHRLWQFSSPLGLVDSGMYFAGCLQRLDRTQRWLKVGILHAEEERRTSPWRCGPRVRGWVPLNPQMFRAAAPVRPVARAKARRRCGGFDGHDCAGVRPGEAAARRAIGTASASRTTKSDHKSHSHLHPACTERHLRAPATDAVGPRLQNRLMASP